MAPWPDGCDPHLRAASWKAPHRHAAQGCTVCALTWQGRQDVRVETKGADGEIVALVLIHAPGADSCSRVGGGPDDEQLASQTDHVPPWRLGQPLKEVHYLVDHLGNSGHCRIWGECRGEELHRCEKVSLDRAVPRPAGDDRQVLRPGVAVSLLDAAGDAEARLDTCEEQRHPI